MTRLSERALSICRTYWREDARGRVAADCCAGCPLHAPCNARYPLSMDGTRERADTLNRAADALEVSP